MRKKYIFTDIDGTLYEHQAVPPSTVDALRQAFDNGHQIYLCTGRPIEGLPPEVENIIPYAGKICSSGSYIELDNKVYLDYFFPDDLQAQAVELFDRFALVFTLETNSQVFFSNLDPDVLKTFPDDFDPRPPRVVLFDPAQPWPETNKMCIFAPQPEPLRKAGAFLPTDNLFITQEMKVSDWWYCEISPRNISKGSAINYLVNTHRIPYEDTVAIGDSMNDYEMIKFAQTGIAMGNGDPRLKEIADFLADDLALDGYARAFKALGFI